MTLTEFADKHRVKVKRDSCGDTIIPGRNQSGDHYLAARIKSGRTPDRTDIRSHIFDGFDNGNLAVLVSLETRKQWFYAKQRMVAAGFTIRQDGDTEGTATFDPTNAQQAEVALDVCGVKQIRQVSDETKARLVAAGAATRLTAQPTAQYGKLWA